MSDAKPSWEPSAVNQGRDLPILQHGKRRWYQFTIWQMLLVTTFIAGGLALLQQQRRVDSHAATVQRQTRTIGEMRQRINLLEMQKILNGSGTDEEKLAQLSRFVKLGDSCTRIESVLGERCTNYNIGPMWALDYWDSGILLLFDESLKCCEIGYHPWGEGKEAMQRWLIPKTEDDKVESGR